MLKAKSALTAFILINCFQSIFSSDDTNFLLRSHVAKTPHFPTIDINNICNGVFFEARPFPGNTQFFIGCVRGGGIIMQCRENEFFNENELKCMMNDEIETTSAGSTTTAATEPPDYNALCEGLFFDFIAHPSDCGQAIFCYEEQAILRECPAGTIFDVIIKDCRAGNRDTCVFYDMPPATNVPVETTTSPNLDGVCSGVDFGFLEHPNDCGFAIFCFNQEKVLRECSENHIFDIQLGICRPGNRDTCEFANSEEATTTTTTAPDLDALCYGREFKFIEHPTDCGKAIFCFNQKPVIRECPQNTIFDIATEDCREGNRETCLFYTRHYEHGFRNPCEGLEDDALIPHEMDLTKFYRCATGTAYTLRCDYDQVFDSERKMCVL